MALPFGRLSFPEMYERELVEPLFRPWVAPLLDDAALRTGQRVLDVACGTGIVARLARTRVGAAGAVVGVDVSAPMLAVARRVAPEMDWREGDAGALPLRDGERFDAVLCQQGLQFFADKPGALREMARALAAGGRLAVSVWRSLDEAPLLAELHRLAERRLGPIVDRRHAFGDAAALGSLLREAGFQEVAVRPMKLRIRFADLRVFVRMNAMALVGMCPGAARLGEDERAALLTALEEEGAGAAARRLVDGALEFDLSANLASANAMR